MKYVLDANAAAFWVLSNPLTPNALRLRDDYRRQVHDLIAPAHFPQPPANVCDPYGGRYRGRLTRQRSSPS